MTTYPDDHFMHQFDRYPEGPERFAALAAHAAMLLTKLDESHATHMHDLRRVIDALSKGTNPVMLAMMINEVLLSEEEHGSFPSLRDIP